MLRRLLVCISAVLTRVQHCHLRYSRYFFKFLQQQNTVVHLTVEIHQGKQLYQFSLLGQIYKYIQL